MRGGRTFHAPSKQSLVCPVAFGDMNLFKENQRDFHENSGGCEEGTPQGVLSPPTAFGFHQQSPTTLGALQTSILLSVAKLTNSPNQDFTVSGEMEENEGKGGEIGGHGGKWGGLGWRNGEIAGIAHGMWVVEGCSGM